MKNLGKTRNKLSIIFTIILVLFFLFVGSSFLYLKYYNSTNNSSSEFNKIYNISINNEENVSNYINSKINELGKGEYEIIDSSDLAEIINSLENDIDEVINNLNSVKLLDNISDSIKNEFPFTSKDFLITDKSKNLLVTNINNYKDINYILYLDDINDNNDKLEDDKLVGKISLKDYNILIFINLDYNLKQFQKDLLFYCLIIFLISFLIYFIVRFLVSKTLMPVEENIDSMNHFIHNAGHELKTPLAVINSSQGLLKETRQYDEELIEETLEELKRANKLIDTLRDFSNIKKDVIKEEFFVSERVSHIVNNYKNLIEEKNISLEISQKVDWQIKANKYYFDILISNLLSNAIKYNKEGGKIKIIISMPYITIKDSGIGIPKGSIKKVFDRFYRVQQHRDRQGFGLGLSIIDKIVKVNNRSIELKSEEGIGTEIKIRLS